MYVLLDIVCADLVSLRERGKYLGLIFSWSRLAAAIGPVIGGALAQAIWRWIFYLNIPIHGLVLAAPLVVMRMKTGVANSNRGSKLQHVDYLENPIFIPSMISLLLGLVMGGIQHPWSSWRLILPLVFGAAGWIVFPIQQAFTGNPQRAWPLVQ